MSAIERRVALDTGLAQGTPDYSQPSAGDGRREATDADRQAFEHALATSPDEVQDGVPASTLSMRPFSVSDPLVGTRDQPPPGLANSLEESVDRLLVGDGLDGGRREVRVVLREDVLPGVTLSIYQEEGRIVASFICADESSREKLVRCAATLAEDVSRSLGQAALVQVRTDDPEDPCLFEAAAET